MRPCVAVSRAKIQKPGFRIRYIQSGAVSCWRKGGIQPGNAKKAEAEGLVECVGSVPRELPQVVLEPDHGLCGRHHVAHERGRNRVVVVVPDIERDVVVLYHSGRIVLYRNQVDGRIEMAK